MYKTFLFALALLILLAVVTIVCTHISGFGACGIIVCVVDAVIVGFLGAVVFINNLVML